VYRPQRTTLSALATRGLVLMGLLAGIGFPAPATAQSPAQRLLGALFNTGGIFPTSSSGRNALGSSMFYDEFRLYGRPRDLGNLVQLSGGLEVISYSDHFFPFTGDNRFNMFGGSARITTKRVLGRLRPFFSAGLFYGDMRSERQGFSGSDFTPSLAAGAEWPFARYFTLTAGYRLTEEIRGVDTSGFFVAIRIF
jgi:hypothetical protein